ncbi:MAG: hypothetical protein JSS40_05255 [Proteobacteria bacterium]|nr:hypothetical protein [Pseudomonadota bacterium]
MDEIGNANRTETDAKVASVRWRLNARRSVGIALCLLLAGAMSGCATEAMQRRQQIEQRIATANSPADHEALAVWYDKEAKEAEESAERHRGMGEHYDQWASRPQSDRMANARDTLGSTGFWERCESLVRLYAQAAEENRGLAKLHRRIAAGMKQ